MTMVEGGPVGRPAFLRGVGFSRRGVGAPAWGLRGRLWGVAMPSSSYIIAVIFQLASAIGPIFVVYNSSDPLCFLSVSIL